jgi:hypothetical protein
MGKLSEDAGEEDNYASFGHSFDSKNIKNMNEAFEGQFCSGCLGPQITTKIGLAQPVFCNMTKFVFVEF